MFDRAVAVKDQQGNETRIVRTFAIVAQGK